jgi:hypothetical protein
MQNNLIIKSEESAAPTGPGSGSSAPGGGQQRAGHKYIKRTPKPGGGWDYEYAPEPGQHHGIQNTANDEHTLSIPSSISEETHKQASGGDKNALKQVYQQSRQAASDLPSTKGTHRGKHPVTGSPVEYGVIADKASSTGHRIKVFDLDEKGNRIKGEDGKPKKASYIATDWDKIHKWHKMAPLTEEIKGPDGTTHYMIMPVSDEFDEETNKPKPSKDGLNWRLKVMDHAAERGLLDKRGEIRVTDKDSAKARLKALQNGHVAMQQNAGKQSATEHIGSGKSAAEVLEGGHLPVKVGTTGRAKNLFKDDKEKDAFIHKLATEKGDMIRDFAEKYGQPLDGDLENVTGDKHSNLYNALDIVARNYRPGDGKNLDGHIVSTINNMNTHGHFTRDASGKRVRHQGIRSQMSMQGDEKTAQAADAAAAGVLKKEEGGGTNAAQQTEDDMLDSIDQRNAMMNKYKDTQTHKLRTFASQYADNKDVQDLINVLNQKLKASSDPYEYHKDISNGLSNMGLSSRISDILVHPDELMDEMGKSFSHNNPVLLDFHKSYAVSYAVSSIVMEEDLVKATTDRYSHKDGSLYPRYYYKDGRGNYVRYTNAPDGTDDASKFFGEAQRYSGEPDYGTNPEFFTPDGRKLSRVPAQNAPVEWNRSYHPSDTKNLWAGRWVNPVTGAHEYTYVESDLFNNDVLNVHRNNVVVDARLNVLRKYVVSLMQSQNLKDKITGLMLALLDQGRFRIRELISLRVGDVRNEGDIYTIGRRKCMIDNTIQNILTVITSGRQPQDMLFMVPRVGKDGGVDYSKMRRLGPHYVVNIIEEMGIPLQALATYHASQTYSVEIQRMFSQHNTSYNAAHTFALLEVASEMGHNLDNVEDFQQAIEVIGQTVVDPIVVRTIKQNVTDMGIGGQDYLKRPVHQAVYHVVSNLDGLTQDERLFSQWIHSAPIHNYL